MNAQTVAIASTVVAATVVTKIVRNRRALKRIEKDFEETVRTVNIMLVKTDNADLVFHTLSDV